MKTNFLNNQNYILGESEKKKLLTKLFIEISINKFYKALTLINYYIGKYFWILYVIVITLGTIYYSKFISLFILLFPLSIIISNKYNNIKKIMKIKINKNKPINFSNYIFNNFDEMLKEVSNSLIIIIKIVITFTFCFFMLPYYSDLYFFIISAILTVINLKIKTINLLLVPVVFVYELFVLLFSFIYIFIFRGINRYIFIKKHFKINLLSRFSRIDWEIAENRDFIIKLKG